MQPARDLTRRIIPPLGGRKRERLECGEHGPYEGVVVEIAGKERKSICPQCKIEQDELARQREAAERQMAKKKSLRDLLGHAGIPPRFIGRGFDTYNVEHEGQAAALKTAREYAERFDVYRRKGEGLIFLGTPGTGKTHLAAAIGKAVIRAGHTAVFATVLDVLQLVKATYRRDSDDSERDLILRFAEPDLLILDEVGVQHRTVAEVTILTDLVNKRYERMKPTILLSNLTVEELEAEDVLGQRIMDRMREVNSLVTCKWDSHRGRS